jgi:hypothetical protein
MVSESSGRNESERRNGLETGAPEAAVDPTKESGFVTRVTFFEHFRCPLERLEGTAETEETAETRS